MAGGGSNDEATTPDLTALMDVLSNIIFFLMASFGAAVVAVLPASVPTISQSGDSDVARDEDKVTLNLQIKVDGTVKVSIENNEMLPNELDPYDKTIPGKEGSIDIKLLNDYAWSIKEKFRKSKNVMIVPADLVSYGMIVDAMDATRERSMALAGGAVASPEMFPAVVLSSLVK